MNRAFYITGIVFSVLFFIVAAYYVGSARTAYMSDLYRSFLLDDPGSFASFSSSLREEYTIIGALWSLFFMVSFITFDIMGILKIKTTTAKVMGIIGVVITGIFILWDCAMLASPAALSFDEVGPAFVLYCFIMLAFSIVGLVQSVRYHKLKQNGGSATLSGSDLLDS